MSVYVCAIATVVPRLMEATVATHPHRRISKRWHVADVKKLHWSWPCNPNGRSKFCNLVLFMFTRSQLTLGRRLMVASGDCSNGMLLTSKTSPAMIRIDRNSTNTKIYACEIKQNVSNNFFLLLRTTPRLAHHLLSCYHSQRLLCPHSKNKFSTTLTPTEKPRL